MREAAEQWASSLWSVQTGHGSGLRGYGRQGELAELRRVEALDDQPFDLPAPRPQRLFDHAPHFIAATATARVRHGDCASSASVALEFDTGDSESSASVAPDSDTCSNRSDHACLSRCGIGDGCLSRCGIGDVTIYCVALSLSVAVAPVFDTADEILLLESVAPVVHTADKCLMLTSVAGAFRDVGLVILPLVMWL